jgi:hypothetical protein
MKNLFLMSMLIMAVSSVLFGQSMPETTKDKNSFAPIQPIKGWRVPLESDRQNYDIYLETKVRHQGNSSASIKSSSAPSFAGKSAFLVQTIKADNYRGQRVRLSVYAKAEKVEHASLWMRMDGDEMIVMNIDAMEKRPITGTFDWQRYDIVLEVPNETQQIIFGVNLKGAGQIWVDSMKFEEVGQDIPVTSTKSPTEIEKASAKRIEQYKMTNKEDYEKQLKAFLERNRTAPLGPVNLDFEN